MPLQGDREPHYRIESPYPKRLSWFLSALPFLVTFTHVFVSPYTKVEESFTLHAVHDILAYGTEYKKWDYVQFPGAVPRSFLPSILIAVANWPWVKAATAMGIVGTKLGVQVMIRLGLCIHHGTQFNELRNAIAIRYGPTTGIWFVLFSLTQFHVPYYAGRTLQNFIALPLVYSALAMIIHTLPRPNPTPAEKALSPRVDKRRGLLHKAIVTLVQVACVIRAEEAMFLIPIVLSLHFRGRKHIMSSIFAGIEGALPVAVFGWLDYGLWSEALPHPSLPSFTLTDWTTKWKIFWPELGAMYYNAIQGQASKWGVEPWDYYFSNSLPKLLMSSILLIPAGVAWQWLGRLGVSVLPVEMMYHLREVGDEWVWGALGMMGALSCLGHKEWRFIVYVVPVFNALAAITAAAMWTTSPPRLRSLVRLGLVALVGLNTCATVGMTYISSLNYPGGHVWEALEELQAGSNETVKIHFSPYPLSTGASLFTFIHAPISSASSSHISPDNSELDAEDSIESSTSNTFGTTLHTPASGPIWHYSKDEDPALLTPQGAADAGMDYVVLGANELPDGDWLREGDGAEGGSQVRWKVVKAIQGYDGIRRKGFGMKVAMADKVVILARDKP